MHLGFDDLTMSSLCHHKFDHGEKISTQYGHTDESYFFYGMFRGTEPLGFAVLFQEDAKSYVIDFFCALKGYGKFLMRHIQHDLCSSKCSISLFSVTSAFNFYQKMGFTTTGNNIYVYKRS